MSLHGDPDARQRPAAMVVWLVLTVEALMALLVTGHAATNPREQLPVDSGVAADPVAAVDPDVGAAPSVPEPAIESPDDRLRAAMLGISEDDYKGHRVLTLSEDGSGLMIVEPAGLAAFTYAPKLTFTERWTVADGTVRMDATGGQPAIAVQMILKLYGSTATFRIEEVTSDRMILIDLADKTRFEWRRVEAAN